MNDFFTAPIPEVDLPTLVSSVSDLQTKLLDVANDDNEVLQKSIDAYNERYNTSLTIPSIAGILADATQLDTNKVKAIELISKDIAYKLALVTKTRTIITNIRIINVALNKLDAEMNNLALNDTLVALVQQLMGWIDVMNGILEDTKVNNFDDRLKATVQSDSGDDLKKLSSETVEQLLSALRG